MQNPENRIWELLALKLSGEATAGELLELHSYLESSPDLKKIVTNIESYWDQKNNFLNINDATEEERFHLILNAENEDEIKSPEAKLVSDIKLKKQHKYTWLFAAASIIIMVALTLFFTFHTDIDLNSSSKTNIQQVFVKPGSRSKIILPDGTVVRLNSSSKLTYKNDFNENVREVNLEGEACFDVTKDVSHPFIVHTSNIDIRVLGTLFNVKSYEQDPTIETTLLRGSIEVFNKNDASAPKVILKPNEKMIFRKKKDDTAQFKNKTIQDSSTNIFSGENISISALPPNKPDSLKEETSWLYNKLIIDNDDFVEMAKKMERWYGVKIEILSPALKQYHFKGIFENETIEQALNALQLTAKFKFTIKDNIVHIKE
jgi:ferric-dicitrate binding protein FerR (iron transport regulator)